MPSSEKLSDDMSKQIEFLRMFMVLGIMFIHYGRLPGQELHPLIGYAGQEHGLAVFVSSYIVFLALCGVPILSAISGFLFFRNTSEESPPPFLKRLGRRFKSLFLPLLIWNGLIIVVAVALLRVMPNDTLVRLLEFNPAEASWLDYADSWIGIFDSPVVYPMWFVRDLCLTALLAPVFWLALRHAWWLGILVLGGAWLIGHDLWIFIRTDIPFFFYLGALVAINGWQITLPRKTALALLALYLVLIAIRVVLPSFIGTDPNIWVDIGTRILRFLGVVALWTSVPLILHTRWVGVICQWSPRAFFVHCAHFPLISVINYVILANLLPRGNDLFLLLHFVLTVSITLALLFLAAAIMSRFTPRLFYILSGSRKQHQTNQADIAAGRERAVPAS